MPLANKATKRVFSAGAYLYGFDIQDKDSLFSAYDIINEILPGQLLFVNSYRFADRNTENIDEGTSGYFTIIEQEGEVIEIRLNILNLLEENNSQTLIDFINSGDREILFKNQSDENISSFSSQEAILENNYVKILITSSELISNFDNEQSYKLSLDFIPTLHSKLILDDGSNPHGTTKDDLGLGSADNTPDLEKPLSEDAKESLALKVDKLTGSSLIQDISITRLSKTSGENTGDQDLSGYASLVNGTVPTNQLPSYVDDVLEFASLSGFPNAGETGKIYIALETDKQYRWTGSNYLQITNGLIASTNDLTEGSNNLYFTVSRVLATLLTSFTPFGSSSNLAATDSIFTALRKLQTRVALNDSKVTNSTNADTLDNLNSTQFLRSDASASFSGSVFTIDDDKQLRIGDTSPNGNVGGLKLQATGSEILTDMGCDIVFRDAGNSFANRFKFIRDTGDLEVSGNITANAIKLTSGATDGYFLKTDSSGNGSWTPISASQVYKGTWNADTNTPTLADGTGVQGNYYRTTVAGTSDLGSGNIIFAVGDDVSHNGSIWEKIPAVGYTLQTATDSVLGGVKIGIGIIISNGVISVNTDYDGADAATLGGLSKTQFLRSDASASFSGSVFTIDDDKQLIFGSTSPSGNVGYLKLQASGSELLSDMGADITYRDAGDSFNFRFKFYRVTGNFQISGNFIGNGSQLTALPNALVIASLLTSFTPFGSSSNISATDSIFTALRKLQTRVALNDAKSVPTNNNQLQNGAGYITSADGGNAQTLQGLNKNDFVKTTTTSEPTGSDKVLNMVSLTQAEYDAGTPIATTLYIITDQNGNGNGD
jgi:hypothetical protein